MNILLVNDDGIHAPGLLALKTALAPWGNVTVVAPAVEQSGVAHSITYLHPLLVHREVRHGEFFGWRVEGSPADCVKLGILELSPKRPDLVVSGINAGANVGINVLYSGTVAGAIEGAFYGITSIAVSQWIGVPPDFDATAARAVTLCKQLYDRSQPGMLWNVNFPQARPEWPVGVRPAAMGVRRLQDRIEKRLDPRGRPYYWSGLDPITSHARDDGTDIALLQEGYVTVTPLHFDLTERPVLSEIAETEWFL